MQDEVDYFEARARQEAGAADASEVPEAAFVHRQLAKEYEIRARDLRAVYLTFEKEFQ